MTLFLVKTLGLYITLVLFTGSVLVYSLMKALPSESSKIIDPIPENNKKTTIK